MYNIKDERLRGIRPTTAAHEMLHAAYNRLGNKGRQELKRLLDAEYEHLKQDAELADRMAFYDRTQPGEHENELHSIIGTEIRAISPELEKHYSRYFSDRAKVLSQREQYYSVFKELRDRAASLSAQIDETGSAISQDRTKYGAAVAELQASIDSFNGRANRGEFPDRASFDRERAVLVMRSSELESLRHKINSAITRYNQLVGELNAIAIETEELNRSIDSNLAPAPSL